MELLNTQLKAWGVLADQPLGAAHTVLLIPWLIFLGMGLMTIRLIYQAWQEQAVLDLLIKKIRQEKLLQDQKQDFSRLSSHYLRTPLTLIATGLEAMASQTDDKASDSRLKQLTDKLQLGVESLLSQDETPKPGKKGSKPRYNASLYLGASLAGSFVIVSLAVYLLAHLDTSNLKLNGLLSEIVLLMLMLVLLYGSRRSKANRQTVKKYYEELLEEHRQLDQRRNQLIRGSLDSIKPPLERLKTELGGIRGQQIPQAVIEGVRSFESVLRQFTILSSLETGSLQTLIKPISLSALTSSAAGRYSSQIEQKSLQLRTDIKADDLKQDPLLVEFVLTSLLDNAIEYSRQGGKIDIISRRSAANTDIFIRDDGQTVPADKLAALFKPFSRAEEVEQFEHQGLGLSLYLDRLVMQYLGGGIKAEAAKPAGLTIKLRLPTNA